MTASKGTKQNSVEIKTGTPIPKKASQPHRNVEGYGEITPAPIRLGISKGITRNLGDFQSLRVDVWLEDYKQADETLDAAYIRLGATVDLELQNQVNSILAEE